MRPSDPNPSRETGNARRAAPVGKTSGAPHATDRARLPAPPSGLTRRGFLGLVVAGVAAACTDGGDGTPGTTQRAASGAGTTTTTLPPIPPLASDPFTLGVASGDPLEDSVILWTRLALDPLAGGGMPEAAVPLRWEIFADGDGDLGEPVLDGDVVATAAFGHSVHVDVRGLDPDTWYRYRFSVGDWQSPIGRTRTAPAADSTPESLRFAFASCQHWESGQWTAYPHMIADEPDLVIFLGDYIYEGAGNPERITDSGRNHLGPEIVTLEDYRNRHALYKSDVRLQDAHAACPWVVTWDDHEVENNYAGLYDENGSPPEEFEPRRAAAYQAYYEHLPLRVEPPEDADMAIYRSVQWGTLADLLVLDTRQYRSDHVCGAEGLGDIGAPCADMDDPNHVLLGREQEEWLHGALQSSSATWKVLANQMVFGPMPIGTVRNLDQWDGYPNDRRRLLHMLAKSEIDNVVVVTGDIHSSGVAEVHALEEDTTSQIVAVELVGTSISSGSSSQLVAVAEIIESLEWVKYVEVEHRGYVLCTVTPDELRADYRFVQTALAETSALADAPTFVVRAGTPGVERVA